jgi:hypothetical protein
MRCFENFEKISISEIFQEFLSIF